MFNRLPRDLQLEIIKRAGMNARIALGLIGRLRVPQRVTDAITAIRRPRVDFGCHYHVALGAYTLEYFIGVYAINPDRWQVCAFKQCDGPPGPNDKQRMHANPMLELRSTAVSHDRTTWTQTIYGDDYDFDRDYDYDYDDDYDCDDDLL